MIHGDLVALIIFGLVTCAEVKLHPSSSLMRATHRAMACLVFFTKVGKLGAGMWL